MSEPNRHLVRCHHCGEVSRWQEPDPGHHAHCPRCGGRLHQRLPNSLNRTWALVITGFILYIPANLFPVMNLDIMGSSGPATIFTGVVELFDSGMWAIGLLVFCASITVPLMKLCGLTFLLITVQYGSNWRLQDRTTLYQVIDFIGRWSMLDVFLVSILVALVNLGAAATITPEIGATFFAAVVVVTIFAANSFDPRLIWDASRQQPSET